MYGETVYKPRIGSVSNDQNRMELLDELLGIGDEVEWLEFKINNFEPDRIGKYISGLGNTALMLERACSYLVWGIEDNTRSIVGTTFSPYKHKVQGQELSMWLNAKLKPNIDYHFDTVHRSGHQIIILTVKRPLMPVSFDGIRYIRVGSALTGLASVPEKERLLWEKANKTSFENTITLDRLHSTQLSEYLDFQAYSTLSRKRFNQPEDAIADMCKADLLKARESGYFDVTNLGALLLASDLDKFDLNLKRKAVRVIFYKGKSKIETLDEQVGKRGYASGFLRLIKYLNDRLPHHEEIGQAFREKKQMYPEVAIRELVANALIHQDLSLRGTGPIVEVYSDRVEISNPGTPLIDPDRFIDNPARSRNESLAYQMRQFMICEERGSGIKKVVHAAEQSRLPAPSFATAQSHTTAIIYAHKEMSKMSKDDKIRACYQHACLKWVENEDMTNASLRERFGIEQKNYSTISRLIADATDAGKIKPLAQEDKSKKNTKYVPYWAEQRSNFAKEPFDM